MHAIYQFLLICVVFSSVFSVQDTSLLIDCLTACLDEVCQDACNDHVHEIGLYSQVDEDTVANTSLQCSSDNFMIIKFNSGKYIIEQRTSEYPWNFTKVRNGDVATFTNLSVGTDYQFRFYKITKDGISRPETSSSFSTYPADYVPLPVKNISLFKIEAETENKCSLRTDFTFEPAEDRSCNYNILVWSGEHDLVNYDLKMITDFRFELKQLSFSRQVRITMFSVNSDNTRMSTDRSMTMYTPTCLNYYNNDLTICNPEDVKGLQATHVYRYGELYDLNVSWDKPEKNPDNYTIHVDLGTQYEPLIEVVPGYKTQTSFLKVKLGFQYEVSIVADSLGGTSYPSTIINNLSDEHTAISTFYPVLIVGVIMLFTIMVLVGTVYLQCYKQKKRHFSIETKPFESLNSKDSPKETITKLLDKDYTTDIIMTNYPFIHDKFELRSKLLKLYGVLGSGAYGIVKLGSLSDEFGNVNNVAVKMLKDNPSAEDEQNFYKEIKIMKIAGQHPNIVSLIGCCVLYNKPVLVVEYCCKGDLQTYLRTIWQNMVNVAINHRERFKRDADSFTIGNSEHYTNGKERNNQNINVIANRLYDIQEDVAQCTETVTVNDLLNFTRQITIGMEFLSSNRIIHRDLAARNILVCEDGVVKISDFGLSRAVYQENLYRKKGHGKLPLRWMAIEALTHQLYSTYSDVWSFGILLWEIVTMGAVPYPGIPNNAILGLLKSGYRMERPPSCGVELYNIMLSCWTARPQSRPTLTQLKQSVDKILSNYSDNKYLNIQEIIHDDQYHSRVFEI
ncbi:tyrosine-protein kinase receptor torso-like [Colletes latitarsis]|uniref:tyrosine-protein kinase receptor torso-like n=1 Tax=Colletes latitarsis TaxID=2605962 RepID=UPI004036E8B7